MCNGVEAHGEGTRERSVSRPQATVRGGERPWGAQGGPDKDVNILVFVGVRGRSWASARVRERLPRVKRPSDRNVFAAAGPRAIRLVINLQFTSSVRIGGGLVLCALEQSSNKLSICTV